MGSMYVISCGIRSDSLHKKLACVFVFGMRVREKGRYSVRGAMDQKEAFTLVINKRDNSGIQPCVQPDQKAVFTVSHGRVHVGNVGLWPQLYQRVICLRWYLHDGRHSIQHQFSQAIKRCDSLGLNPSGGMRVGEKVRSRPSSSHCPEGAFT